MSTHKLIWELIKGCALVWLIAALILGRFGFIIGF